MMFECGSPGVEPHLFAYALQSDRTRKVGLDELLCVAYRFRTFAFPERYDVANQAGCVRTQQLKNLAL